MKLNKAIYRDKVYACWIGKNIGGTMGTPYEGKREMNDIKGFVTKPNEVLPNDDLDLQLVWLCALERTGLSGFNANRLGEFWLSYITPHWNEYGIGKANMTLGIQPPISGEAFNTWKHSNGAWIRTEIWASLAPGAPDVAMRYAYEDACVDHGTGEGTIAAMFIAAIESAAFVENDIHNLIKIGLSKIPENSRLAQSIRLLLDCYAKGMDYREARNVILKQNADIGTGWFEAPSNVTYAILGLLWGEGDFKKSMIYAINCGDDTDCTGATVGSILGIIGGTNAIPDDWKSYIGDKITSDCIAHRRMHYFSPPPTTCTELTDRIMLQVQGVLDFHKTGIKLVDEESDFPENIIQSFIDDSKFARELASRPPYTFRVDFEYASALITLEGEPRITAGGQFCVHAKFISNVPGYGAPPRLIRFRWLLPDGFRIEGPRSVILTEENDHYDGTAEADFRIMAPDNIEAVNRIVLEALADGRFTAGYMPIVLLG